MRWRNHYWPFDGNAKPSLSVGERDRNRDQETFGLISAAPSLLFAFQSVMAFSVCSNRNPQTKTSIFKRVFKAKEIGIVSPEKFRENVQQRRTKGSFKSLYT